MYPQTHDVYGYCHRLIRVYGSTLLLLLLLLKGIGTEKNA